MISMGLLSSITLQKASWRGVPFKWKFEALKVYKFALKFSLKKWEANRGRREERDLTEKSGKCSHTFNSEGKINHLKSVLSKETAFES